MDWYYPVLTGVLRNNTGLDHLFAQNAEFEIPQRGIRCVSDRPWVTTAETCECAMAYFAVGEKTHAIELFTKIQDFRDDNGRYLTGVVYPEKVPFPEDEFSTYSAAAVILTADALLGCTEANGIFADHNFLPSLVDSAQD